jgi:hypothetical protein
MGGGGGVGLESRGRSRASRHGYEQHSRSVPVQHRISLAI